MKPSPEQIEAAFAEIEAAAMAGARCPMNESVPGGSRSFKELALQGRILVEVFVHNFRRVTIIVGPHAGKSTQSLATDSRGNQRKPYLTIAKNGTFRNGRAVDSRASRTQPSAPRNFGGEVF